MRACLLFLIVLALAGAPATPAQAIAGNDPWAAPTGDADLDAGKAAFEREDWPRVIESMTKVVVRRPWDDVAHTLLGFAYRKLGRYDRSLAHYGQALELNPHNRGALEYLGEAYLELARPDDARAMLERLEGECQRDERPSECEEWVELKAAYDGYLARGRAND